jgi:ribosomal protein S18 acetylase RimI-like enzyme
MGPGRVSIENPRRRAEMEDFARLPFLVYAERKAWWPPDIQNEVDLLSHRSPLSPFLEIEPFVARRDGKSVARVSAVINLRYNDHWKEKLGQLIHFEALPDEDEAAAMLLEAAAEWLRTRAMEAVRSGFAAFLDYPYAIDNYGAFPSFLLRANPAYYHRYLKNAGFETERGQIDYTARLTPEIIARYHGMLDAANRGGIQLRSWREFGFLAAVDAWTGVTNIAFRKHWGWNPVTNAEVRPMLTSLWETPVADLSMIAMIDRRVVGAVFCVPDFSEALASLKRGVKLPPDHGGGTRGALINIGVIDEAQGRGVARAMAARSFIEMQRQGMQYAGYTLVLDDNWASRRTAESLGARVTGNFLTYRRNFRTTTA